VAIYSRRCSVTGGSGQQTEDGDALGGADVDFAVGDHRDDEFVVAEMVAARSGLIGIVEFRGQVGGGIGVKNGGTAVLDSPDNAVGGAAGGDRWRGAGIRERVRRLGGWAGGELAAGDGERLNGIADGTVVDRAVEVAGLGKDAACQLTVDLLVDVVGAAVELAHVIAIDYVDVGVFARADGKMKGVAVAIDASGKSNSPPEPKSVSELDSETVLSGVK